MRLSLFPLSLVTFFQIQSILLLAALLLADQSWVLLLLLLAERSLDHGRRKLYAEALQSVGARASAHPSTQEPPARGKTPLAAASV